MNERIATEVRLIQPVCLLIENGYDRKLNESLRIGIKFGQIANKSNRIRDECERIVREAKEFALMTDL